MKKIVLTALALCGSLCLFACGNEQSDKVTALSFADGSALANKTVQCVYGQTPNLSHKVYALVGGAYKEVALTDPDLTVSYSYTNPYADGATEIEKLPDNYLYGGYTVTYSYKGLDENSKITLNISIDAATKGAFTVRPAKKRIFSNEVLPEVTVSNPDGKPVLLRDESATLATDDTHAQFGTEFGSYLFKKSVYNGFTATQKTDYEFINSYKTAHESDWVTYTAGQSAPAGEYMLLTLIDRTYNYQSIVTPAVEFTVTDALVERTFTFQGIVVQDNNGVEITDPDDEQFNMVQSIIEDNEGRTVICKANKEVRGTVDFGGGSFDNMTGDEVCYYYVIGNTITVMTGVTLGDDGSMMGTTIGTGVLDGNTLTLTVENDPNHIWVITFTAQ